MCAKVSLSGLWGCVHVCMNVCINSKCKHLNTYNSLLFFTQEAHFAPGPFIISPTRREAAGHTTPFHFGNLKILSGLTGLEVDPWGFVLPLTPLVWTATLMALLGVLAVLKLLPCCLSESTLACSRRPANYAINCFRVILQQGEAPGTLLGSSWLHDGRLASSKFPYSHGTVVVLQ